MTTKKRTPITVLVVDDHEVVRLGLRTLFKLVPGIRLVGEAATMAEAVQEAVRLKPDVVLMDIRLPDGSGIEACWKILAGCPSTRVLFLTSYTDDQTILAAILAGAQGYVLKEISSESLIQGIKAVAAGHSLLNSQVVQQTMVLLKKFADPDPRTPVESLSPQEQLTLSFVAEGKTNKEIATLMDLSQKTVKNYLAKVYEKLHVSRRSQATALYIRHTA